MCCASTHLTRTKKGEQLFFGTHSWEEIWNGYDMRNIRQEMLKGKKLTVCKSCFDEEKVGKISKRIKENKKYLIQNKKKLEKARKDGYVFEDPFYLDLRFGNLCDLRCRTCNPQFSSAWQAEIKTQILGKDSANISMLNSSVGGYLKDSSQIAGRITKWYKNEALLSKIKKMSQHLKILYFTGGEPLLIKEIESLMDHFLKTGDSDHIMLHFNSNITRLSPSFLEKMSSFLKVKFGASIDSHGEKNNWLRFPSDFSQIEKNMESLMKKSEINKNIYPYIHCTVSVYNILYMKEIIDWSRGLSSTPPHVAFNLLHAPEFQHIVVLTKDLKQKAIDNLNEMRKTYKLYEEERNGIDSCLKILKSSLEDNKQIIELREQLKEHTLSIDRWRNEDFFSVFPELKETFA